VLTKANNTFAAILAASPGLFYRETEHRKHTHELVMWCKRQD